MEGPVPSALVAPGSATMTRNLSSLHVDQIYAPKRMSETWVLSSVATQLMYADVNWKEVAKQGCKNCSNCKHSMDGLRIPIVEGSVDISTGALLSRGAPTATLVLEWPCCDAPAICCAYLPTFKAQLVAGDSGEPIAHFVSEGGMKYCPLCNADAAIVVTDGKGALITQLEGTKQPCCNLCEDDSFPRLSAVDGTLLQRYFLDVCANGPAKPIGFRRIPVCFCPCYGKPVAVQTYDIANHCGASPEVWVALTVFEAAAYPYHKGGGGGGDGGGGGGGGG